MRFKIKETMCKDLISFEFFKCFAHRPIYPRTYWPFQKMKVRNPPWNPLKILSHNFHKIFLKMWWFFWKPFQKKFPWPMLFGFFWIFFFENKRMIFCPKKLIGWTRILEFYPTRLSQVKIYLFIGSPSKGETKICSFYVVLKFEEITLG